METLASTTQSQAVQWKPPHIKLYYVPICPWSQRVRLTAAEVGLDVELIEVPMSPTGQLADWFTAINPRRMVPTVQITFPDDPGNVQTVTESMIICRLLVSLGKPRSRCLLPGHGMARYEVDWFCDEADRAINDLYHYCMKNDADVRQAAMASLDRMEVLLAKNGGPFALGNHFSLADIAFGPFFDRMVYVHLNFNQQNLLTGRPHLQAFQKACLLQPSFLQCLPTHAMITETYKKFIPRPFKPPRLKLYAGAACPFSQRVRITLKLLGLDYDIVHVDMPHQPEWYKKINPHGMLPTLELASGERMFDSIFIIRYLITAYCSPIPLLHPLGKEAPLQRARIDYLLDELEKKIKIFILFRVNHHHIHADDMTPEKLKDQPEVLKEIDSLEGHIQDIEDLLLKQHAEGPFFLGDEFSYADIACAPFFAHFLGMMHTAGKLSETFCPRIQMMHAAIRQLDGVDEILSCMVTEAKEKCSNFDPATDLDLPKFTPHSIEERDENGNSWASGKFKTAPASADSNTAQ